MIDIHAHILPGVDDGARSMEEAIKMAGISAESGVRYLVVTPHSNQMGRFENFYGKSYARRFEYLQQCINHANIPLRLLPGMEIYASHDMGEKIRGKQLIGLNGSRYYLVEWDFHESPEWIRYYLQLILHEGKVPVIAHPERYICVQEYPSLLKEWREMGCQLQINRGSLFGKFGEAAEELTYYMLERNLVTCIASDAHHPTFRSTYLADAKELLESEYGKEYARKLLLDNPLLMLQNKNL